MRNSGRFLRNSLSRMLLVLRYIELCSLAWIFCGYNFCWSQFDKIFQLKFFRRMIKRMKLLLMEPQRKRRILILRRKKRMHSKRRRESRTKRKKLDFLASFLLILLFLLLSCYPSVRSQSELFLHFSFSVGWKLQNWNKSLWSLMLLRYGRHLFHCYFPDIHTLCSSVYC